MTMNEKSKFLQMPEEARLFLYSVLESEVICADNTIV